VNRLARALSAVSAIAVLMVGGISCSNRASGTPVIAGRSASLQQALGLVPASAAQVEFADMAAAKQRWGMSEVNSGTLPTPGKNPELWKQYQVKARSSAAESTLANYIGAMTGWGWNALDVDWEIRLNGQGPPVSIYRLRSSLDMTVVTESLVKHTFTRSGTGDAPRFDRDIADAGDLPIFLSGVTVVPAEHLLISTPEKAWAAPAPESSLAGDATSGTLTAGLPPAIDYLHLSVGPPACIAPRTPNVSPKQVELKRIRAAAEAVTDDSHAVVRTQYADHATATADLDRRRMLLRGDSPVTHAPYTTLFTGTVTAQSATLRYDLTVARGGSIVRQLIYRHDAPWALCSQQPL
jgi:hypothetical protein